MAVAERLELDVQYACRRDELPGKAQLRAWASAALKKGDSAQVTVRFADAGEGRTLNRDYRGKDYATNVLSFPYQMQPVVRGDLVLCAPVVAREAAEQGKSLASHYAHLIVHGMLHLQGHDHEASAEQAAAMESREARILARLGYPDPYRDEV